MKTITELGTDATRVAELRKTMTETFAKERAAEAMTLVALINTIEPALVAMCAPVVCWEHRGDRKYLAERGILIAGRASPGESALWLFDTGELYIAEYRLRKNELSGRFINRRAEEAVEVFDVSVIADNLSRLMNKHLQGKAKKRIDQSAKRTKKLQAVATLLDAAAKTIPRS